MTAAYRPLPIAIDVADDGSTWIAPLPDGPITELEGAGPAILGVLLGGSGPMRAADIAAHLAVLLEGVPDDLEAQVGAFLDELAALGIVSADPEEDR